MTVYTLGKPIGAELHRCLKIRLKQRIDYCIHTQLARPSVYIIDKRTRGSLCLGLIQNAAIYYGMTFR